MLICKESNNFKRIETEKKNWQQFSEIMDFFPFQLKISADFYFRNKLTRCQGRHNF